jgi:hypothetical protein
VGVGGTVVGGLVVGGTVVGATVASVVSAEGEASPQAARASTPAAAARRR